MLVLPPAFSLAKWVAIIGTIALGVVSIVSAGCGSSGALPDAGPPQYVDASVQMPPGVVLEGTWTGRPGESLTLSLSMTDPVLDWDIHTHDGGGTQTYVVQLDVTAASYTLVPSHATSWYLLVKNDGGLVEQLDAQLELVGGSWTGWP